VSAGDLVLDAVGVGLGGREVLAPLSTRLSRGRFVALLGPNGAGKSSLVRAIAGLVPNSGRITLDDVDIASLERTERARRVAYLPQGQSVHWPLSVRDIVALGRFPHGLKDPRFASREDDEAVETALVRTGILGFAQRNVTELSGGEKARVALARTLATGAGVILADEPTAALDPRYQISIMETLREETRRGALVVAVTHDLGLAARMADQVLLLHEGRLVADGPPAEVLTAKRIAEVYGVQVFTSERDGEPVIVPWAGIP
jgi:iron complex transport system ATP-binding protein